MHPLYFLYDGWALLAVRVALGAVLIAHGRPKLRDLKATAANFDGMGFKPGKLFATCAMLLEFFGGIAIVFGFLTMIVVAFAIVQFVVIIIWKLRKSMPLVNGWELDLLVLTAAVVLFSLGGGTYSLDHLFFGLV